MPKHAANIGHVVANDVLFTAKLNRTSRTRSVAAAAVLAPSVLSPRSVVNDRDHHPPNHRNVTKVAVMSVELVPFATREVELARKQCPPPAWLNGGATGTSSIVTFWVISWAVATDGMIQRHRPR
jgi:hypothetical protein